MPNIDHVGLVQGGALSGLHPTCCLKEEDMGVLGPHLGKNLVECISQFQYLECYYPHTNTTEFKRA